MGASTSRIFGTVELSQRRGAGFRDWGAGGRMVYPISHASANGDSYRVAVKGHVVIAKLNISCYLQGSPTGRVGNIDRSAPPNSPKYIDTWS